MAERIVRKEDLPEEFQFQASLTEHPIIENEHGTLRYQANQLIDWLWKHQRIDLNELWRAYGTGAWSRREFMQLYRDLGYSLSGFEEVWEAALVELEAEVARGTSIDS